jgi:CheY-like chemotaxis protein
MDRMLKILVVDDEEVYCRNLRLLLEREGHEVQVACDGPVALATTTSFCPDLLIVDWMLRSEMNGLELAVQLHAMFPQLHSILITGFPADELELQLAQTPVTTVIRKPFALEELITQIELLANPQS